MSTYLVTPTFLNSKATRRRGYDAEARAAATAQKKWQAKQLTLAVECGKTRCELCTRQLPLVTWDEREHVAVVSVIGSLMPARPWSELVSANPVWRICRDCFRRALAAKET